MDELEQIGPVPMSQLGRAGEETAGQLGVGQGGQQAAVDPPVLRRGFI